MQPQLLQLLTSFISEFFKRFVQPSPKYFRYWHYVLIVLIIISGVPSVLDVAGIHLTGQTATVIAKFVAAASSGALFMASQTSNTNSSPDPDPKKLPFSAKK